MYLNEGGILFILQRDAGCSMRLVADDQVKVPLEFFLGIGDNSNGLVCGKNNDHSILVKLFSQTELSHDVRHSR